MRVRHRQCNNPVPKYEGLSCAGDTQQEQRCRLKAYTSKKPSITMKGVVASFVLVFNTTWLGTTGTRQALHALAHPSLCGYTTGVPAVPPPGACPPVESRLRVPVHVSFFNIWSQQREEQEVFISAMALGVPTPSTCHILKPHCLIPSKEGVL